MAPNVKKIRRNNKNDNIKQQRNINMLNRFVSDSFWRGIDRIIGDRISVVGVFIEEVFDLGSNIGSAGDDDVDSTFLCSEGVVEDSSDFVSDFFL